MSFIASGDVSDFSPSVVESIKIVIAGIANHAPGVQLTSSNIEVTLSSASVNVLVMIHAPSAQAAASITAVMAGVFLSPATLEAALTAGGTEDVSITQIISAPTLQPPQMNSVVLPSTASDQGSSLTWAVVAGLAGLGILLLGLVSMNCTLWVHLKRQSATSAESAAKQATSNEVAIEMMRNLATQSKPRSFLHSCSARSSAKPSTSATFDGPTPRLNRQPSLDEILEVEQDTSVCPASLPPSLPAEQSKMKPVLASSTSPPRGMIKLGAKAASCDAEIGLASQSPSVKLSPLDIAQVNRYRFSGIIVAPTEEGQTSERNERAESARDSELKDAPGRLTSRYSARLSARREVRTSTHLPVPAGLPDPRCRPQLPSVDVSSSTRPSQLDLNQDGVISEGEMASRFLPRTVREGHMAVAAEAPSKPVAPQDEAEDGPATVQQI